MTNASLLPLPGRNANMNISAYVCELFKENRLKVSLNCFGTVKRLLCCLWEKNEKSVCECECASERRRRRADCVHTLSHLQQVLAGTRCCEATDSFMLSSGCFPRHVDSYLDWVAAAFKETVAGSNGSLPLTSSVLTV